MTIYERATAYAEKKMCAALDLKPDCINRTDAFSWRVGVANASYYFGGCIVRYLHEAESFLALHNIELIKE